MPHLLDITATRFAIASLMQRIASEVYPDPRLHWHDATAEAQGRQRQQGAGARNAPCTTLCCAPLHAHVHELAGVNGCAGHDADGCASAIGVAGGHDASAVRAVVVVVDAASWTVGAEAHRRGSVYAAAQVVVGGADALQDTANTQAGSKCWSAQAGTHADALTSLLHVTGAARIAHRVCIQPTLAAGCAALRAAPCR